MKELRPYTGALTPSEKSNLKMSSPDEKTLKSSFKKYPKFNVTIRREDLFDSSAQVIVNAANTHLGGGTGIDGAIHQKGGDVYKKAHKALQEKYAAKYILQVMPL